ncbi:transketolase family protein [Kitasatospora brasiliensis]|uniref:transketolase family protein n=1 Tax=Kitasatospora brasiliensis TaxID=3058040 RepID=UPI00292F503F|nr:transketolase C-terminal domain-containing protein [Kitasatospora sp. K002]
MTTSTREPVPAAVEAPAARPSREVYRDLLAELIGKDERLVCLDSDTGLFSSVDWGAAQDRYVNLGIAEQNMMGVAAGLARCGRMPFANTMAAFAGTRALEAVKLDIALNNLPVRIAATHSGLSAGHLGSTHHALEDLAVMRLLPNMTVLVPADAAATEELVRASLDVPGPVYLRLGRGGTPDLGADLPPLRVGVAQRLRSGRDVTLIATGPYPVLAALAAAKELADEGIAAGVLNMHTVKPLDVDAVVEAAETTAAVVTVEEHWAAGGLGSAIAEVVAGLGVACPVRRVAVQDRFAAGSGGQQHLLERNGITAEAVAAETRRALLGRRVG